MEKGGEVRLGGGDGRESLCSERRQEGDMGRLPQKSNKAKR